MGVQKNKLKWRENKTHTTKRIQHWSNKNKKDRQRHSKYIQNRNKQQ